MKSKKLISLLCAAAMSASAFAGLTVTASAATDLVTLDGSTADGWVAPDGADKGDIVPTVTIDEVAAAVTVSRHILWVKLFQVNILLNMIQ